MHAASFCAAIFAATCLNASAQSVTVQRDATGVVMHKGDETMHITVCGAGVLHIVAGPGDPKGASPDTPWITKPCAPQSFEFTQDEKQATLKTAQMQVAIQFRAGLLSFRDAAGHPLLNESFRGGRVYTPVTVNGEKLYRVSDRFMPGALEGFYGLGQHQSGVFNYNGNVVELAQANTDVAIPLLFSTNGYGILWNTAAKSWFDNRFPTEFTLKSDAADAIDYYFLYGPDADHIIHSYRNMTGHAPLFGKWAYGFIQSKDRYRSAKELLEVASEYRDQHVPLDMIVQDWFWWKKQGDPQFTDEYLKPDPDVAGAIQKLHDQHIHTIISTWAVTDEKSDLYKILKEQNLLIPGTTNYDPSNPKARDVYWQHLEEPLMKMGWDGFWLDSAEPECCNGFSDATLEDKQLSIGNGARYTNIFPLLHSGGIYQHWRAATNQKRLFILTRSAFLGQQRNATTVWSGDVIGTFPVFKKQIAAGLNFQLSGIPYWTTDIAGYGWPYERDTRDPSYQELYTRWYQFGVFCPIFRTHGHRSNNTNEIFAYGPQTPTLIAYDNLRYRMLPYIYSLAWKVTSDDYTIMRPLVMDWRDDVNVRFLGDEYMFGPDLLVSPVTEEGATQREVYLPPAPAWYDFWTGEKLEGGRRIMAQAPLDRIPLYVKAGSILPLGPEVEYATQSPDAPLTLRIYRGAEGDFTLYEDAGDTYDYENGQHTTIPLHWDDAAGTLTVGARNGSYPGMAKERVFRVVLVTAANGAGAQPEAKADKEIHYTGAEVKTAAK